MTTLDGGSLLSSWTQSLGVRGRGQLSHFSDEEVETPGWQDLPGPERGEGVAPRQAVQPRVQGPVHYLRSLGGAGGCGVPGPHRTREALPAPGGWPAGVRGTFLSSTSCTLHSFLLLLQQISNLWLKNSQAPGKLSCPFESLGAPADPRCGCVPEVSASTACPLSVSLYLIRTPDTGSGPHPPQI